MNLLFLLVLYVVCSVNGHNDAPTTLVGPCHRRPDGFARDLDDCRNYFVCHNGHTIRGSCPDSLLFDAEEQKCSWPEDVTCFVCPRNKVYALLPVPHTCNQFYQCWMWRATIHSCPGSLVFDPKLHRCNFLIGTGCEGDDQEQEGCPAVDGPTPVYLAHATSCVLYYVCSNGTPLEQRCAQGLHFNPILHICDTPANANCQTGDVEDPDDGDEPVDPAQTPAIPCPDIGHAFKPHRDTCNAYFACVNGEASLVNCAPGLHFDYERETCDRQQNARCWSHEHPPGPNSQW